ncbi:chorismate lyase [Martelella alba]|uniref:Probable chorismate pyruvate-lyase n=1 Tax=Martelella alba TaxID=2590451 RepID=A0ABY2SGU0_9HYPH|nr:chorismate lyase [Martelella alba]TKI04405.1 chorismate lyase [Martelella alba]
MTDDPSTTLLAAIRWFDGPRPCLSPTQENWLLESDSMTLRLERHCRTLSVRRIREGYCSAAESGGDSALLPASGRYWLREVVLYGDGRPWLAGRTLIPAHVLGDAESALTALGDTPLGRWLFREGPPARDFIQLGRADGLWARRSRLHSHGKPLLLTELFLSDAPLYR